MNPMEMIAQMVNQAQNTLDGLSYPNKYDVKDFVEVVNSVLDGIGVEIIGDVKEDEASENMINPKTTHIVTIEAVGDRWEFKIKDEELTFIECIEVGCVIVRDLLESYARGPMLELRIAVTQNELLMKLKGEHMFLTNEQDIYINKKIPIVRSFISVLRELCQEEKAFVEEAGIINEAGKEVAIKICEELGYKLVIKPLDISDELKEGLELVDISIFTR